MTNVVLYRGRHLLFCLYAAAVAFSMIPGNPAWAQGELLLLRAARIFDGDAFHANAAILLAKGRVTGIGPAAALDFPDARILDLGDATILPGFIELHAHLLFRKIPGKVVLKHGITTLRDVGGPVRRPSGGDGHLRVFTSGPILTAPGGYPIPMLGQDGIAIPISTAEQARETVGVLIADGAVVIKIALEPGGEVGAPWASSHGHGHDHGHSHGSSTSSPGMRGQPWPLLPVDIVKAIVEEAHQHGRKVTAHVAEERGVRIAVQAGVDEWAHVPCEPIPEPLLRQATAQGVVMVTTLDTLSACSGIARNIGIWAGLGGAILYGAEIAHPDIPWGINAQELMHMMDMAGMERLDVLRAATSEAGRHLGIPLLGTLQPGAPADVIAVRGSIDHDLKRLEYPGLVISGGRIIVDDFTGNGDSAP